MTRRTGLYLPALLIVAALATLLAVAKEQAQATFTGKNGKIAFVRTPGGNPGREDIYTMNPNGTGLERLTNYPREDFEPAWSPDGSKIAFMSFRGNLGPVTTTYSPTYTLYTMNANGTSVERLIKNPRDDHDPAWSPDGSKIAFARYGDGEDEIYTVNADGTGLKRLTHNPKEDSAPTWSPEGNRIAFHSKRDGNYEIYTIKPNGTGLEHLTNNTVGDFQPAWSPEGNKIAFVSNRDGKKPCRMFSCYEIYTMNANGTRVERLTNNTAGDYNPDWQPLSPPTTGPSQGER
jgi:Tol biopolymer transport system component